MSLPVQQRVDMLSTIRRSSSVEQRIERSLAGFCAEVRNVGVVCRQEAEVVVTNVYSHAGPQGGHTPLQVDERHLAVHVEDSAGLRR